MTLHTIITEGLSSLNHGSSKNTSKHTYFIQQFIFITFTNRNNFFVDFEVVRIHVGDLGNVDNVRTVYARKLFLIEFVSQFFKGGVNRVGFISSMDFNVIAKSLNP